MKAVTKATGVKASSGNVFADLRLPNPPEALAKAQLAQQISDAIASRGLTQAQAAELLGLDQPKISALVRGKLSGFSTDRLFRFLNDLGQEIEIVVRPAKRTSRRGAIHVVALGGRGHGTR
jgi:predicted XRE-type DNA-binding protein